MATNPFPLYPRAWLAAASPGHCGVTTAAGDCAAGERGVFQLADRHWASWEAAASGCLGRCERCARCRHVTVSQPARDCSWYADCPSVVRAAAFRSAPLDAARRGHDESPLPRSLRPDLRQCLQVPVASLDEWRRAIDSHLTPEDRAAFERATGSSVAALVEAPRWRAAAGRAELAKVMSNARFVAHELNALGLHPLRALLFERLTEARRRRNGFDEHRLFQRLARDGLLVLRGVDNLTAPAVAAAALAAASPAAVPTQHGRLASALHAASGHRFLDCEGFSDWTDYRHHALDAQGYLHIDTIQPTWKVWLLDAASTARGRGPPFFVPGSHRNGEGRLRWLFNRSRAFTSDEAVDRLRNARVTPETVPGGGPYTDRAFGFNPAIRFEGFDPADPGASRGALRDFGFGAPAPVVTPAATSGWTVVIADTSGLHYRGAAPPGTLRRWAQLSSSLDGEPWMPRKNPFFCEQRAREC